MAKQCGFRLSVDGRDELSGVATPPCDREPWDDSGRCILHADCEGKPLSKVRESLNESNRRIDAPILRDLDMTGFDFSEKLLFAADFSESNLSKADFSATSLQYADFEGCKLDHATFGEDTIAKEANFDEASCLNTNFISTDLHKASFVNANMVSVKLKYATLTDAVLDSADLSDAKMQNVNLRAATLSESILSGAKLQKANLERANFLRADLRNANLSYARSQHTDFRDVPVNYQTEFGEYCIYEHLADSTVTKYEENLLTERPRSRKWEIWFSISSFINRIPIRDKAGKDADELEKAYQVYRRYRRIFEQNTIHDESRKYRIREKNARRKLAFSRGDLKTWGKWSFLRILMGYGEKPQNTLLFTVFLILVSVIVFLYFGIEQGENTYYLCLPCDDSADIGEGLLAVFEFSIMQFLPGVQPSPSIQGNGRIFAAVFSAIGAVISSIFVYTLGRRAGE